MFEEFKAFVNSCTRHDSNDFLAGYPHLSENPDGKTVEDLPFTVELVDSWGGEDQGTSIGAVYRLGGDIFAEVYGSYYSYDGSYYEDTVQVEPYEEVVTRYRKVR